jgi:hypothetical protein
LKVKKVSQSLLGRLSDNLEAEASLGDLEVGVRTVDAAAVMVKVKLREVGNFESGVFGVGQLFTVNLPSFFAAIL